MLYAPSATTIAPGIFKLDLEPFPPRLLQNREVHIDYLRNTQEQANILWEIVEQAKAKQPLDSELDFACKYATRIQELLLYVQDTCPSAIIPSAKKSSDLVQNGNNRTKSAKKHKKQNVWKPTGHVFTEVGFKWKPTGRIFTIVGNSFPLTRITSTNVVPPNQTTSHSDEIQKPKIKVYSRKPKNVGNIGYPDCTLVSRLRMLKHMTGNRSQLMNFVSKFMGIVRFGNDQIARIMGYNTACYTQNRSLIRLRYNKTLYELMQDKKLDLSFFHVFGLLCYPINDHEDLGKFDAKSYIVIFVGYAPAKKAFRIYNRRIRIITKKIDVTFDELTAMASEQFSSGPGLQGMTPATSSTGLGSNPVSQQPCLPPLKYYWDRLFQPMFDEYFNPPPIAVSLVQKVAAPRAEVLADSLVSTSID
ncbi:retrovirus-related pol polyprotein from transposon TNT 1-94 [Tanacetum coccineum]